MLNSRLNYVRSRLLCPSYTVRQSVSALVTGGGEDHAFLVKSRVFF